MASPSLSASRRARRTWRAAMKRTLILLITLLISSSAFAAGTLVPVSSGAQAMQIKEHHVNVVIDNGFARTEVVQVFHNPNDKDLEAIYCFSVPEHGSISVMTIWSGVLEMTGE